MNASEQSVSTSGVQLAAALRSLYGGAERVPLHAPTFQGREKQYLIECIDTTFVSSVGAFVDRFERDLGVYTGSPHVVAVVNGTQALFLALTLAGVGRDSLVITQSATFVATANAIRYCGADPVFVDIERETLGMDAEALRTFLESETKTSREENRRIVVHRGTGRHVSAVVPMHTFGHPCRIAEIADICREYGIPLVEDAAEGLGSFRDGRHTGTSGLFGTLSFNGNKIITTGGGGAILCGDVDLARRAKHLTTTAKVPHPYEFVHDEVGYNFRLPNLNAALGVAQLERLEDLVAAQRDLAGEIGDLCDRLGIEFVREVEGVRSNCWLNAILLPDRDSRDAFLWHLNAQGIEARALWRPMHQLPMYMYAPRGALDVTEEMSARLANISSTPRRLAAQPRS